MSVCSNVIYDIDIRRKTESFEAATFLSSVTKARMFLENCCQQSIAINRRHFMSTSKTHEKEKK